MARVGVQCRAAWAPYSFTIHYVEWRTPTPEHHKDRTYAVGLYWMLTSVTSKTSFFTEIINSQQGGKRIRAHHRQELKDRGGGEMACRARAWHAH